jgi:hypothetical protein
VPTQTLTLDANVTTLLAASPWFAATVALKLDRIATALTPLKTPKD